MTKKMTRARLIGALSFGALCLPASVLAQEGHAIAERISRAYGVESWSQVEAIGFTFNIAKPKVTRSWVWEPKADRITYDGPDKDGKPVKITYVRSQLAKQSDFVKKAIDPAFINDQYALMFPLHLAWDTAITVQAEGTQRLPLGKGSAPKVVVTYASGVGYTPGDTWDLYLADDGTIQQLVLHHGGTAKPSLVPVRWGGNKRAGALVFSTDKRGTADGNPIHLFFTNVTIKQAESSTWIAAK